jgi:hypothetical protein
MPIFMPRPYPRRRPRAARGKQELRIEHPKASARTVNVDVTERAPIDRRGAPCPR